MEGLKGVDRSGRNRGRPKLPTFRRQQLKVGLAEDLLGREAENFPHGAATVNVTSLRILLPKPFACHLRHLTKAFLAFGESFLGAVLLGNVLLDRQIASDFAFRVA